MSAVILAAGSSSRMGTPKLSLHYRGETFLGRLVRLFKMYCEDVVVVASQELTVDPAARVIVNPAPERGMLSSLQCGFGGVHRDATAIAFTPVDFPAIEAETITAVIGGWRGELLRIPRYQGRRGHPVLVSRQLVSEFLALPEGAQARDVVHRHEDSVVYADVEDAGILLDVDTPADYEQLR